MPGRERAAGKFLLRETYGLKVTEPAEGDASKYKSMASRTFFKASSRVLPCDQQLFRAGQCATNQPSSPGSMTIFRFTRGICSFGSEFSTAEWKNWIPTGANSVAFFTKLGKRRRPSLSDVKRVMIRNIAAVNLKQRSARAWRRLALGPTIAVRHFLLRQLHIQATPQLYPPEFTGLNNCDQGASWARPDFFTGWLDGSCFLRYAAIAGDPPGRY